MAHTSRRLEAILISCPYVLDCAVIGIWSPEKKSEFPRVYVVLEPSAHNEPDVQTKIAEYLASRVAPYKRLGAGVFLIDEIPKRWVLAGGPRGRWDTTLTRGVGFRRGQSVGKDLAQGFEGCGGQGGAEGRFKALMDIILGSRPPWLGEFLYSAAFAGSNRPTAGERQTCGLQSATQYRSRLKVKADRRTMPPLVPPSYSAVLEQPLIVRNMPAGAGEYTTTCDSRRYSQTSGQRLLGTPS